MRDSNKDLVKFGVENSSTPKPRQENVIERINRINYEYGNSKERPKHLDNKSIYSFEDQKLFKNNINRKPNYPTRASPEQFGKAAERIERARQQSGSEMNTWEIMKAVANTPAEKKEIRETILRDYKKNGAKNMAETDLKWIGKSRVQNAVNEIKIDVKGISDSINNYINAQKLNAPIPPPPKQPDPDLNGGLAAILGAPYEN